MVPTKYVSGGRKYDASHLNYHAMKCDKIKLKMWVK